VNIGVPSVNQSLNFSLGDPSSAHAVPTFRNLTASSESLEVVQRWIDHCLTSHDCSKSLTGGEFKRPTRLLDVNAFESSCLDLRLVETIVSNSHYAALSYCWGIQMDTTYKTTLSTLEKRKDRIEFTDLPLTYRHAVEVTRNLGLRYLWIDALCIIQGCLADWQHESARMADVYGGSFLTISADWSSNSNSGCYNSLVGRGNIDTQQLICVRSQLSDSRKSSLYFGVSFDPSLEYLEALALFKRAWACQERLLSPRILHYTDEQLLWECRRAFCAEDGIPRQHESVFPGFVPKMRVFGTNGEKLDLWYNRIIDIYSKGELTIPIDRLPAMSALARIWAQDLQSPYLAGMWLHGLWIALCWYRLGDNELTVSPTDYIAPSWSWASVNASVKWLIQSNGMFEEQSVRIEEASVELDGEDPFGRVLRGSIRLSGHIQKGRICRETLSVASEGKYIELSGPVYLDYAGETLNAVDCLLIALEGGQMWMADNKDPKERKWYLLLLVATSDDHSKYRRRGIAEISGPHEEFKTWPEQTITII
jgi:hypothetical protein